MSTTTRMPPDVSRVDEILSALSVRERVGQLNQRLLGWEAVERRSGRWCLTAEAEAEIERWSGLGAIYGLFRADAWSGRHWGNGIGPDDRLEVVALVQDAVRSASRHGIGALVVEEAPHGHQALGGTILPQNLALAATWDAELVREASAAVAAELSASGVDLALVSGLDILRDGRWGRSEECLGEDPLLAARLARAIVEGMQGPHGERLSRDGVGVVLKHLAGQGEAVGGRNGQSAIIGERDLREIHLPPAAAAIDAGVVGLMAAYNDIDGIPCCANPWLLRTWLRQEQGFTGIVMADGFAVDQLLPMAGGIPEAGRLAVTSGVDLSLWDEGFTTLADSAERHPAVATAVEDACRRILTLKERLGLLPDPALDAPAPRPRARLSAARQRTEELSRDLAAASLVLLDGPAPALGDLDGRIVVLGPNAHDVTGFLGDYVAPLAPGRAPSVTAELAALLGERVRGIDPADDDFDAVVSGASAVVAVLGGTSHRSYSDAFAANGAVAASLASCGEGADLADLRLPGDQDALVARARRLTTAPLISVVVAGRPHVLTDVLAVSETTIWAGYAGPHGPAAVAAVLAGRAVPPGRLPFTVLRSTGVTPVRHNDRVSARNVYRDVPDPVLLPFATGSMAGVRVENATAALDGGRVVVRAALENPGDRDASIVVPVFVRRRGGAAIPRQQELADLRRERVPAGGSVVIEWRLPLSVVFGEEGVGARTGDIEVAGVPAGRLTLP